MDDPNLEKHLTSDGLPDRNTYDRHQSIKLYFFENHKFAIFHQSSQHAFLDSACQGDLQLRNCWQV